MKKNIIGHMLAPKSTKRAKWQRLDLLPRLLCLLLAFIIWLLVVNVMTPSTPAADDSGEAFELDVIS